MGLLHKALNDAVDAGLLEKNPAPRASRAARRGNLYRSNSDPFTPDEVRAFLAAVPAR